MPETGMDYPTLTLAGVTYTIRLTRGALYRLGKAGIEITPRFNQNGVAFSFFNLVDIFHAVSGFQGTPEEAAEVLYDHRNEFANILIASLGKLSPRPTLTQEAGAAEPIPAVQ